MARGAIGGEQRSFEGSAVTIESTIDQRRELRSWSGYRSWLDRFTGPKRYERGSDGQKRAGALFHFVTYPPEFVCLMEFRQEYARLVPSMAPWILILHSRQLPGYHYFLLQILSVQYQNWQPNSWYSFRWKQNPLPLHSIMLNPTSSISISFVRHIIQVHSSRWTIRKWRHGSESQR